MLPRIKNRKIKNHSPKIIFLGVVFFILWFLVFLRLIQLQIVDYKKYRVLAENLRIFERTELAERGLIYTQEKSGQKFPIATNNFSYTLYVVPRYLSQPEETAAKIALALGVLIDTNDKDYQIILEKVSKSNSWYEILRKNLTLSEVERIKEYQIESVGFEKEVERFYPDNNYFSHILGFIGYQNHRRLGQYGLEEYYNNILSGKEGVVRGERSASQALIPTASDFLKEPKNGSTLLTTLDRMVQIKTCDILDKAITNYQAKRGTIIVVEPSTGKILALCNWPNFNLNEYAKVKNMELYLNNAVSSQYEPGSVFKVITMAAGLEDQKIKPETIFEDKGSVKIGSHIIKNAADRTYGQVNMRTVLEKSINTGAVFVAQEVGRERFLYWTKKFGFGEKTDIDLPGEARGNISNLLEKRDIYLATASFGHGLAVTPIQMVMSFAAIANGGKLMKPYLVQEIISEDTSFKNEAQEIRQVLSPITAETLKDMMISSVEEGWGKRAGISGYLVAGKTGTAEIPDLKGYSQHSVHSFIGFAPADKPKFVALVKLDEPAFLRFSDQTAAPVFGELADFLLKHYQIPPSEIK